VSCFILSNCLVEIGLGSFLWIVRTSRSASPLEYVSNEDAEGDIATNGSYVTPVSLSPVCPEELVIGDAIERGEPTGDCLDEVRTLVPIEENEEVPNSESDEVPEENEDPLPLREQPPAYSLVRRGQRAMRGGQVAGPHRFHRHCFPYLADPDRESYPKYFQWEIAPPKRRRALSGIYFTDDFKKFIFQSNSLTFTHSSLVSHDHSSSKQDKTFIPTKTGTWCY